MPLLSQKPENLTFFIVSLSLLSSHLLGGSLSDNAVLSSAAAFFTIPRALVEVVFLNFPLLAPLAALAFFAYFSFLDRYAGEALTAAAVVGAIVVMAGV